MENIKIPYGEADFKTLREENYIYIDKTEYIKIQLTKSIDERQNPCYIFNMKILLIIPIFFITKKVVRAVLSRKLLQRITKH